MEQEVTFSNLSIPLKILVVLGWIMSFTYMLYFIIGFGFGMLGYY